MPKMSNPPVAVMAFSTLGLWRNNILDASSVIEPWTTKTESAEKATPIPKEEASAMEATPSKRDLT